MKGRLVLSERLVPISIDAFKAKALIEPLWAVDRQDGFVSTRQPSSISLVASPTLSATAATSRGLGVLISSSSHPKPRLATIR